MTSATLIAQLEDLPIGRVVLDRDGDAWQKRQDGWACTVHCANSTAQPSSSLALILGPFTVLPAPGTANEDESHTKDELYEYRLLYNAHAAHGWLREGIPVVKSRKHSDGQLCFDGGWFIVVADLPTGQVSNHYAEQHWDLFDVPAVDVPPTYDGHTPQVAATRLRDALSSGAGQLRAAA